VMERDGWETFGDYEFWLLLAAITYLSTEMRYPYCCVRIGFHFNA
jgi:hypothetical protein